MGFVRWLIVDLRAALWSRYVAEEQAARRKVAAVNRELGRFVSLVDLDRDDSARTGRFTRVAARASTGG
jgi:hypothetical protein